MLSRLVSAMLGIAVSIAGLPGIGSAQAKINVKTTWSYYSVGGQSALELDSAMYRQGPRVDGKHSYASTTLKPRWSDRLGGVGQCRVQDFSMDLQFKIRLPQLARSASPEGRSRKQFSDFVVFARRHEETHRRLWVECARKIESRARTITAPQCGALHKKLKTTVDRMMGACDALHVKFDRDEQRRLVTLPFIQRASALGRVGQNPRVRGQ